MGIYRLTLPISAVISILLVIACSSPQPSATNGSRGNNTTTASTAVVKPATRVVSTATPEPTVRVLSTQSKDAALRLLKDTSNQNKQGWTTLVDGRKRFSISVPENWNTVINEDVLELEYYQSLVDAGVVTWFVTLSPRSGTNIQFQAWIEALLTKEPRKLNADQEITLFVEQLKQNPKLDGGLTRSEIMLNGLHATRLAYRKESPNGTMLNVRNTFIYGNEPQMGCGSLILIVHHGGPASNPAAGKAGISASILEEDLSIADEIVSSIKILPEGAITAACEDRTKLSLLEKYGRR